MSMRLARALDILRKAPTRACVGLISNSTPYARYRDTIDTNVSRNVVHAQFLWAVIFQPHTIVESLMILWPDVQHNQYLSANQNVRFT